MEMRLLMRLFIALCCIGGDNKYYFVFGDAVFSSYGKQSSDCYDALQTCLQQKICKNLWKLRSGICNGTSGRCNLRDPEKLTQCQSHLETVKNQDALRDCICEDSSGLQRYQQCFEVWSNITKHPCDKNIYEAEQQTFYKIKPPLNNMSTNNMGSSKQSSSTAAIQDKVLFEDNAQGPNCLDAHIQCQQNSACISASHAFNRDCNLATCRSGYESCITAFEEVSPFHLFTCTCKKLSTHFTSNQQQSMATRKRDCAIKRAMFTENACIVYLQKQSIQALQSNNFGGARNNQNNLQSATVDLSDSLSVLNTRPGELNLEDFSAERDGVVREFQNLQNCFHVHNQCVKQPACLELYIGVLRACIWDTQQGRCHNLAGCQQALRLFYHDSSGWGLQAMLCRCEGGGSQVDYDCHKQLEVFKPRCAYQAVEGGTCVELVHKCFQDKDCKDRYMSYEPMCSECAQDAQDSGAQSCLLKYQGIWGTNLTRQCDCAQHRIPKEFKTRQDYLSSCRQAEKLLSSPICAGKYKYAFERKHITVKPVRSLQMNAQKNGQHVLASANHDACSLSAKYNLTYTLLRIYRNDTCSELCTCNSLTKEATCSVMSCIPSSQLINRQIQCQNSLPRLPYLHQRRCWCTANDELLCFEGLTPDGKILQDNTDVSGNRLALDTSHHYYIRLAYVISERNQIEREFNMTFNFQQLSVNLSGMLAQSVGDSTCRLQYVSENKRAGTILYLVSNNGQSVNDNLHLQESANQRQTIDNNNSHVILRNRKQSVVKQCDHAVKLLQQMIDLRHPLLRHNPQLSVLRPLLIIDEDVAMPIMSSSHSDQLPFLEQFFKAQEAAASQGRNNACNNHPNAMTSVLLTTIILFLRFVCI